MSKQTIECPRCHGRVGLSFRGQTLPEALERHEMLTHGPPPKPKPPVEALAAEPSAPVRRRVVRPPKR